MFDREKLNDVLKHYKRDFVSFIWNDKDYKRWEEERYKWEAVQWFKDHWNVKSENFTETLKLALSQTSNLLASMSFYPREMIIRLAKSAQEEVRAMYLALYDDTHEVYEKINRFKQEADALWEKYGEAGKRHCQDERAITTYLWLRNPDKYYIYKYSVVKKVAEVLGADYQFKQGAYAENIRNFLKLYDEICDALKEDTELVELFRSNRSDSCYPDPELKTLTVDLCFYIANFYEDRIKQIDDLANKFKSNDDAVINPSNTSEVTDSFKTTVNTWLLNWNPSNPTWQWEEQEDEYGYNSTVQKIKSGGTMFFSWTCLSKQVKKGDRIFMIKLGTQPRGIFATGYAVSDSFEEIITDSNNEEHTTKWVEICLTGFLDYHTDNLISQDLLKEKFPNQQWSPQASGISIKPDAARWLIDYWNRSFETHSTDADYLDKIEPQREPVIWKIGHGTNSTGIPEHLRSVFEERKVVVIHQGTARLAVQSESQGQAYMLEIKKGDFFYLCYAGEIVLFGQFTDDIPKLNYEMVNEWNDYDWYERPYRLIARSKDHNKYTGVKKVWTSNYNSTCVKVTDNALFEELILEPYFGLKIADLSTAEYHEPYSSEDFLSEVFMTEERYNALTGVLQNKQNIILQGAPGVGKTFAARRLAWSMMGEKDDSRIEFVQFHQNYSYEDFMMGYKPAGDSFELKYGIFYRFCQKAANQPDKPFFFIIDEINRGNMSKIFGELLMLIEKDYRGSKATLAYNGMQFSVPKNLYIIGMMNTADRSLAMIDYALRRRFSFFDVEPGFDSQGFIEYQNSLKNDTLNALIATVKALNNEIATDKSLGKGFCIGHSYFCGREDCTEEWLRAVVNYDILPMLREYWFDEANKMQIWENKLQGVFQS